MVAQLHNLIRDNSELTDEELESKINTLSRMKISTRPVKSNLEKREANLKKTTKGKTLEDLSEEELLALARQRRLNANIKN